MPVRGSTTTATSHETPVDPAAQEIGQFGSQLLGDLLWDVGGGYQSQRHCAFAIHFFPLAGRRRALLMWLSHAIGRYPPGRLRAWSRTFTALSCFFWKIS